MLQEETNGGPPEIPFTELAQPWDMVIEELIIGAHVKDWPKPKPLISQKI
jgi:hypothetical protein